jgi:hypothetical protein
MATRDTLGTRGTHTTCRRRTGNGLASDPCGRGLGDRYSLLARAIRIATRFFNWTIGWRNWRNDLGWINWRNDLGWRDWRNDLGWRDWRNDLGWRNVTRFFNRTIVAEPLDCSFSTRGTRTTNA